MDAYDTWQRRKYKAQLAERADKPRITQADVLREHTLSQAKLLGTQPVRYMCPLMHTCMSNGSSGGVALLNEHCERVGSIRLSHK